MQLQGFKGNSSQLYLLNEHGDLYFLLQISDHYIVGNNQGKFKKKIMSTSISRESLHVSSTLCPGDDNHKVLLYLYICIPSWCPQLPSNKNRDR